ncbi:MAG: class I SAM-dependent methyltransferase, partial [Verrucomicrobiota bacterium]|nr:class I SAM-dependent methyltransferase [Verrucomicrobiota bacterium]
YLPFLEAAKISGADGGVLDLGCGRGEWLELLRERGIEHGSGVDLSAAMVEQCNGRGLHATHADALHHLRTLPAESLEAISSFHLIEHLPLRSLLHLLGEIQRTLRPGGLVILETPNPRNILVGASDFYRDPTHNHPIHPETIRFVLETMGFAQVGCYFLRHAETGRVAVPESEFTFADLQAYVEVPRDFAVIARKA